MGNDWLCRGKTFLLNKCKDCWVKLGDSGYDVDQDEKIVVLILVRIEEYMLRNWYWARWQPRHLKWN